MHLDNATPIEKHARDPERQTTLRQYVREQKLGKN